MKYIKNTQLQAQNVPASALTNRRLQDGTKKGATIMMLDQRWDKRIITKGKQSIKHLQKKTMLVRNKEGRGHIMTQKGGTKDTRENRPRRQALVTISIRCAADNPTSKAGAVDKFRAVVKNERAAVMEVAVKVLRAAASQHEEGSFCQGQTQRARRGARTKRGRDLVRWKMREGFPLTGYWLPGSHGHD